MRALFLAGLLAFAPATARAQMGPHLGAEDYAGLRGGFGPAAVIRVEIEREELDETVLEGETRTLLAGENWLRDSGEAIRTLHDFELKRIIDFHDGGARFVNTATHARARHNLDIYVRLSEAGQAEQIAFGEAGTFDRFWLESALGIAARPAGLEMEREEGELSWTRGDETVARAVYGDCHGDRLDASRAASLIAWLRQAAPIHPEIGEALAERGEAPCALSFLIYSPESPAGRREHWHFEAEGVKENPAIFTEGAEPVLPAAIYLDDLAGPAALEAVTHEGPVPGPLDFMRLIDEAREAGDHAGALLLSVRETHHFGPCPQQTVGTARMACAARASLAEEGDEAFERAAAGLAAMEAGDHGAAIEALSLFAEREDRAGAAAKTIIANELAAWGPEGFEAYRDIDPARLLAEALADDPFAPEAYWFLGRQYLTAGLPEAGWALFDLGRNLPEREITPLLEQAIALEERIEELAPGFFAPQPAAGEGLAPG